MWLGIGCVIFGCLLLHAWWLETYTDSALANMWRRISASRALTRNSQAVLRPCVGLMSLFGGVGSILKEINAPLIIMRFFLLIGLLSLIVGVIYLLPFPLPRFADARYQYLKRHGLLDPSGKALPDEEVERILAEHKGGTRSLRSPVAVAPV